MLARRLTRQVEAISGLGEVIDEQLSELLLEELGIPSHGYGGGSGVVLNPSGFGKVLQKSHQNHGGFVKHESFHGHSKTIVYFTGIFCIERY